MTDRKPEQDDEVEATITGKYVYSYRDGWHLIRETASGGFARISLPPGTQVKVTKRARPTEEDAQPGEIWQSVVGGAWVRTEDGWRSVAKGNRVDFNTPYRPMRKAKIVAEAE